MKYFILWGVLVASSLLIGMGPALKKKSKGQPSKGQPKEVTIHHGPTFRSCNAQEVARLQQEDQAQLVAAFFGKTDLLEPLRARL